MIRSKYSEVVDIRKTIKRLLLCCSGVLLVLMCCTVNSDLLDLQGIMYGYGESSRVYNKQVKSVKDLVDSGNVSAGSSSSISVDTNEWYTNMPNIKGDTSQVFDHVNGFPIYKAPSFDSDGNTWFFNSYKAKSDLWQYLVDLGLTPTKSLEYTQKAFIAYDTPSVNTNSCPSHSYNSSGYICANFKGQDCMLFAPTPAMLWSDWYSSKQWAVTTCPWGDKYWGTYFNVVLVEKDKDPNDQSNWLYLPAATGDAKAHTYPWGVTQTSIQPPAGFGDPASDTVIKSRCSQPTVMGGSIFDFLYCTFEIISRSLSDVNYLNQRYSMVGVITYNAPTSVP